MGDALRRRLKQSKFESPQQEAMLSLLVAASYLDEQFDRSVSEFGISRQQYNILRILKGAGSEGHPCGEVALRMVDRSPDVTRRIDGLVKLGLVDRTRSNEDRRVVLTRITDEGRALLEKITPGEKNFIDVLKRKLTSEQAENLTTLCEQLFSDDASQ
ncbi:MAG: MarR family transcriptional regulator [bacterium]|nr:MarR family transcriptional regulator [Candidatus Kapabacteria bacterium]